MTDQATGEPNIPVALISLGGAGLLLTFILATLAYPLRSVAVLKTLTPWLWGVITVITVLAVLYHGAAKLGLASGAYTDIVRMWYALWAMALLVGLVTLAPDIARWLILRLEPYAPTITFRSFLTISAALFACLVGIGVLGIVYSRYRPRP